MLIQSLYFTGPQQLEIREEELLPLKNDQILVQTISSAISAGTELLVYMDNAPKGMNTDSTIAALSGELAYPLKYGYSCVGKVVETGNAVDKKWRDQIVFAFNPHESFIVTTPEQVMPVPKNLSVTDAVFLPNMETAINLVMDGSPMLGEKVVVFGQGIVGLLTTALLAHHPIAQLITFDKYVNRRELSVTIGAHLSLAPEDLALAMEKLKDADYHGADLLFELSGNPEALNHAIDMAGFNSRIVVGSWYGAKQAPLKLGEKFHRDRIKLISSQVSTIAPELSGRWNKNRRFQIAWEMLREIQPSRFITQKFSLNEAKSAYQMLAEHPEECIQAIFEYG